LRPPRFLEEFSAIENIFSITKKNMIARGHRERKLLREPKNRDRYRWLPEQMCAIA
jgi:hypothetical protein